jgi:hypothetical protein
MKKISGIGAADPPFAIILALGELGIRDVANATLAAGRDTHREPCCDPPIVRNPIFEWSEMDFFFFLDKDSQLFLISPPKIRGSLFFSLR